MSQNDSPLPHRAQRQGRGWWLAIVALLVGALGGWLVSSAGRGSAAAEPEAAGGPRVLARTAEEAGRYLLAVGGCNDCHTPGFMEKPEQVVEADWMTGTPLGFKGPWGTTYASNLRLFVNSMDEEAWVQVLRQRKANPPMPWASVNAMSDQDLRAIYRYLKSAGPKGERMPTYLPPTQQPKTPYIVFEPVMPK